MKKVFNAATVEKCLEIASKEFNVDIDKLVYEVLEEKKGLFRKSASISVEVQENSASDKGCNSGISLKDEKDGTVKILNGEIVIKDPEEEGTPASLITGNNIKVILDGSETKGKFYVYEKSLIEIVFEENAPSRHMDISLSESKMEAYLTIEYMPKNVYGLKDKKENNVVSIETEVKEKIMPPKYTQDEVMQQLKEHGIVYGIMEDVIEKSLSGCSEILIAKGQETQDGEDDRLDIKFEVDDDIKKLSEDKKGNVDFKSIGSVEAVTKGEIIAVKIDGNKGIDGKDVTGKSKKSKPGKKLKVKTGIGCILKDENTVISAIEGKPCVRGNTFYVYQVHEVRSDVDLTTGNIKFIGDVVVYGSVREGMQVEAGNSLRVYKDVERAKIKTKGDIEVNGNIIVSDIAGGGEDVVKLKLMEDLTLLNESLKNLIETVAEIKKFNLLGQDKKDGEIIKVLIESKFRNIPRLCVNIISEINLDNDDYSKDSLIELIKGKLIGLGPINIRHFGELDDLMNYVSEKIDTLRGNLAVPVNVKINYCQDSDIKSSGDVIIVGRGAYVSNIMSHNRVVFTDGRSVVRGGCVKAKNEIRARMVGSEAGVSTKLIVEDCGHIWADTAYQNTLFVVGNKEYNLEIPSKDVHAYLDDKDEIFLDRLVL